MNVKVRRGLSVALGAALAGEEGGDFTSRDLDDCLAAKAWLDSVPRRDPVVLVLTRAEFDEISRAIDNTVGDGTWREEWVGQLKRHRLKAFDAAMAKIEHTDVGRAVARARRTLT